MAGTIRVVNLLAFEGTLSSSDMGAIAAKSFSNEKLAQKTVLSFPAQDNLYNEFLAFNVHQSLRVSASVAFQKSTHVTENVRFALLHSWPEYAS